MSSVEVRPLVGDAGIDAYCRLNLLTFARDSSASAEEVSEQRPYSLSCLVAESPDGQARGYMVGRRGRRRERMREVAADNWPAALALAQHHAGLLAAMEPPEDDVWWCMPPWSPTFAMMADRFASRSETRRQPNANWMARVGNRSALAEELQAEDVCAALESHVLSESGAPLTLCRVCLRD